MKNKPKIKFFESIRNEDEDCFNSNHNKFNVGTIDVKLVDLLIKNIETNLKPIKINHDSNIFL